MLDFSQFRKKFSKRYTLGAQGTVSVKKKLGWQLWNICITNVPLVVNTSRSFPHSWLNTGFVAGLTRRVSLVEQELLTIPEHLSSPSVFSGVRVTRSLVLYVCFVDRCLSFGTFSFGHCVVCSSSIYGFWLPPFGSFKLFLQKKINLKNRKYCVIFQADMSFRRFH